MKPTDSNIRSSPRDNRFTGQRLRVVHVFVTLNLGGAERHLLTVLRHIDKERFDPLVLCLANRGELADEVERLNIPMTSLELNSHRLWMPWNQFRIAKWFKENQVHVVHTHMFHSNCYGRLAALLANVPVRIISVHSIKDAERKEKRWLMRWLERFTNRTLAVSDAVKQSLVTSGYDQRKIKVILHGVEIPPFVSIEAGKSVRAELGLTESCRVISMVARMIPLKRHIDLLQALQAMSQEFADVRLMFIGDGPQRVRLEEKAHGLGLAGRVLFLGKRNDVERLLPASDITVLCSEHEALPVSLLESMAAGLPIVATCVGGIPEIVTQENGILYPPGDVTALRIALESLLIDPDRRRQLGAKGKQQVAQYFSAAKMTSEIEQCYTKNG